ncbi:MAG: hypothetical protein H6825_08260 [Planctomycetes bacterium]|nr:hypothetical protein [Planctomycetota bacterium]
MDFTQVLLHVGRIALVLAIAARPSSRDEPTRPGWQAADGEGGMSLVTLVNLDPKRMPVAVEADDDAKDMKLHGRRKFKPAKLDDSLGQVARLELKSRKPQAAVCLGSAFHGAGGSSTSVRMAWDDDKGFVDGTTLGFFEVRHTVGDTTVVRRLEAVWHDDMQGFSVRAVEDGEVVGETVDYPGEQQLQLGISQFGTDLMLTAAVASGDNETSDDATLYTADLGADDLTYCGAFGAEGLDKGGRIFFDRLSVYGDPNQVDLTFGEKVLAYTLQVASVDSGNAEGFADPEMGFGNVALSLDWATAAESVYDEAQASLDDLVAAGTISGKRAKLLKASIKKGRKAMVSANKLAAKLVEQGQGEGDTNKKLEKLCQKGRNFADLATGQVFGLVSGCVDDVYDWADF